MDTSKKGFGGQWVDLLSVGQHVDDKGNKHNIDLLYLQRLVTHFDPSFHEPPAVIGHPQTDAPAYGWVYDMRVDGPLLQAQFCDVDPTFEGMVRQGKFKKRSVRLYMDDETAPGGKAPALRHVGFLGAQPPAVKGLRNIHFNEGDSITFEFVNFSEGDSLMGNEEKEVQSLVDKAWEGLKRKLSIGTDEGKGSQASFSEADVKRIAEEAVQAATSSFTEENRKLTTQLEELTKQVASQSGVTTHAEIVSFCESLGAAKFPPAFKEMGVIQFMEKLATAPDDVKVTTISFEEKDGSRKEIKTESTLLSYFKNFLEGIGPIIQFGEHFRDLNGTAEIPADPKELEKVRTGMSMKKTEGGNE